MQKYVRERSRPPESPRWWLIPTVLVFVGAILWLIGQLQISDGQFPPFQDVLIARYVLNRWPNDWPEVERCLTMYECDAYVSSKPFDAVHFVATGPDRCVVTFQMHSVLGWKYSKRETLKWSAATLAKLREGDQKWALVLQIQGDVSRWLARGHALTRGKCPAQADVLVWNQSSFNRGYRTVDIWATRNGGGGGKVALKVIFEDSEVYNASSTVPSERPPNQEIARWHFPLAASDATSAMQPTKRSYKGSLVAP